MGKISLSYGSNAGTSKRKGSKNIKYVNIGLDALRIERDASMCKWS